MSITSVKKNPPENPGEDQVCKPGSVLTAIYLVPELLPGSSHLLGTAGQAICPTHGVASDRVYILKPMSPWAGCALTAPFHPYPPGRAVYLCCTCPGVTPGGRYPLSLPCEARTFLTRILSDSGRGCPTWSGCYFTLSPADCQMSCKIFSQGIYYRHRETESSDNEGSLWQIHLHSILKG